MIEKYKISDFTKIDVMKRQFYVCLDEKTGNEKIEFEPNTSSAVTAEVVEDKAIKFPTPIT
jgi:hypothetical protein